jgi:hypothetical protein
MGHKLSDQAIAQIVQLIQLGILTGTDVTDQLRTMSLVIDADKNQLVPSPEFINIFNENIERLAKDAVIADQNDGA